MRKRPRMEEAFQWIAWNDNPGDKEPPEIIQGYMTVALVADLWGLTKEEVARAVWYWREKNL